MEGPGGPLPWPIGAASVATTITLRKFVPSCCFHGVFPFHVSLLAGLTACAPFICTQFTEVHVDRESIAPSPRFLHLHLVFVLKLPRLPTRQFCSLLFGVQ